MPMSRKTKTRRAKGKRSAKTSLNRAATGIFEPSENPQPHLKRTAYRAEKAIDELRNELEHPQSPGSGRQGHGEDLSRGGPHDRIVGPDISKSPFSHIPPRRKPAA